MGLEGAGLAMVTSALLGFHLNMMVSQRHYVVPHDWPRLLAAGVVVVAGVAGLLILGDRFPPMSAMGLGVKAIASLTALAFLARALWSADEARSFREGLRRWLRE
jgi:hypothetical protein